MPIETEAGLRYLRALLDAMNCGAILLDRRGRVVHANQFFCDMLGMSGASVIGRTTDALFPGGETRKLLSEWIEQFDASSENEVMLTRADGLLTPVILCGRPLNGEPSLSHFKMVTFVDISGQREAERRLKEEYDVMTRLSDTILAQALDLKHYSERLEQRVRERTAELHEANMDAIYMLAVASEAKDEDTGSHVRRIQHYTEALARQLGLDPMLAEAYGYAAVLHDVGKMQVPDRILKKPGRLTTDERRVMQVHTVAGERILSTKPFFENARLIARSHHENWDGSGYPDGRSGEETPLPARLVHLVDVYDALTSERVYKQAWSPAKALEFIGEAAGRQFDPQLIGPFHELYKTGRLAEIAAIRVERRITTEEISESPRAPSVEEICCDKS